MSVDGAWVQEQLGSEDMQKGVCVACSPQTAKEDRERLAGNGFEDPEDDKFMHFDDERLAEDEQEEVRCECCKGTPQGRLRGCEHV